MEFTLENRQNNSIVSYENSQVLLSSQILLNLPCFVSKLYQTNTLSMSKLQDFKPENIKPLIWQDNVNLLIIGTGEKQQFLSIKTQAILQNMGLSLEVMPNNSAVRCYNLLLSDYRDVGLLLL